MAAGPTILIAHPIAEPCLNWLASRARVRPCQAQPTPAELRHAEALIVGSYTSVDATLLDQAASLRVVGRAGVGLDRIDTAACHKRSVAVVHTPQANTQAVVEYVLALMLDAVRPRVPFGADLDEAAFHRSRKKLVGRQLDTLSLGILGFGRIGKRLGQVAAVLGMQVLVNDLIETPRLLEGVNYGPQVVDKRALFHRSDVVSVHVDGRAANRHLLNTAALAQLKSTCLLINTSRGMVVDPQALAAWARRVARDGGAVVLDVHEPEPPLPADTYPLYGLPNVRLLPHLASRTHNAVANMGWVVKDVVAVLEGRQPRYPAP